jgi:hypothetical protein
LAHIPANVPKNSNAPRNETDTENRAYEKAENVTRAVGGRRYANTNAAAPRWPGVTRRAVEATFAATLRAREKKRRRGRLRRREDDPLVAGGGRIRAIGVGRAADPTHASGGRCSRRVGRERAGGFGFVDPGGGERGEDGERAGGGDGGSRVDDGEEGDARRRREEAPRRADGHAQRLRPHRARAPVIILEVVLVRARESVALVRSRDGHEDAVRGGLARGVARDAEDAGGVELRHRPHAREELQRQGVRRGAEDHVRDATAAADGAEVGHRGVRGLERGHGELHREEPVDGLGVILQAELAVEQMLNRRQRERLRGGQEEEHRVQPEVPAERVDERGGGGGVAIGPGGGRERGRRAPRGAKDRGGAVIVVVVVRRLRDHRSVEPGDPPPRDA